MNTVKGAFNLGGIEVKQRSSYYANGHVDRTEKRHFGKRDNVHRGWWKKEEGEGGYGSDG